MEQAAKRRQDRSDEGEEQQDAPAGAGAAPEEPFSLLQELPAPLMRQLVQRHLDAEDCLSLLRTSHALAKASVQHRTRQQRRALTWTWHAGRPQSRGLLHRSMDAPQVATAASLLVRWAPAELCVVLCGLWFHHPAVSLAAAALLPLITSLRLFRMHLAPATMDGLQQCQRLHTLDVNGCSFDHAPSTEPAASRLQALPLLRTFRYLANESAPARAVRDLGALCALAAEVTTGHHIEEWAPHFTRAARWDMHAYLESRTFQALLRAPNLRHVQAQQLGLGQDHSQQRCQWETLTVKELDGVQHLLRLPSGVGRVVVTERLSLPIAVTERAALQQQWCAPGRLRLEVDTPPDDTMIECWRLGAEEARGGFFGLNAQNEGVLAACASLLRQMVLPPGGGPCTLELLQPLDAYMERTIQQLAPLLVGTRMRTLCTMAGLFDVRGLRGVLVALPACITCLHLRAFSVEHAREVVSGPAATHALRLVVVMELHSSDPDAEERELRELCAARQQLVRLEVVRKK